MSKIMVVATLRLREEKYLEDWKKLSHWIDEDLKKNAKGFLTRESVRAEDGSLRCVLTWESREESDAFNASLGKRDDFAEVSAEFGRIIDVESMRREFFELI